MGKPDDGTGKEAEGFLRLQERYFTPERSSAHVVGFRPTPVTRRVVQRKGAILPLPLTMDPPEVGGKRGQRCRFRAAAVQRPLQQDMM